MHDLFGRWTPGERWLAGLLWADGYIEPGKHRIQLNLVDEDVIKAAAAVVECGGFGCNIYRSPARGMHRTLHRLVFTDVLGEMTRLGFGRGPDRTWPAELASGAFLRGLFDGDGTVFWREVSGYKYLCTSLCGTRAVLDGAQNWLAGQGIPPKSVLKQPGLWKIRWHHHDSMRLAGVIYADAGPCMERKRLRFLNSGGDVP